MMHGLLKMSRSGQFKFFYVRFFFSFLNNYLNDSDNSDLCRYIALLVISGVCYLGAYAVLGVLFIWFNPSGHDCGLNIFFIVMTMILAFAFAVIALHPAVNKLSLN